MRIKSREYISIGQLIELDGDLTIKVFDGQWKTPIGIAAHDIKKGDIIDYDDEHNTKDILVCGITYLPLK